MPGPLILVVEDSRSNQYVLTALFEHFDFDAHFVKSGDDALAALELARYACVFMDLSLPGMDGNKCARKIRKLEKSLGIRTILIAITSRIEDRVAAINAGMDDFLPKPFVPEDLRRILLRYIYEPTHPNLKILIPIKTESVDGMRVESELRFGT